MNELYCMMARGMGGIVERREKQLGRTVVL